MQIELQKTLRFVVKFFLLETEYWEPYKMVSRYSSTPQVIIGNWRIQPWLTKEDYLSVHTLTTMGFDFIQRIF